MRTSTLTWGSAMAAIAGLAIARGLGLAIDVRTAIIVLLLALASALAIGALVPAKPLPPTYDESAGAETAPTDWSATSAPLGDVALGETHEDETGEDLEQAQADHEGGHAVGEHRGEQGGT